MFEPRTALSQCKLRLLNYVDLSSAPSNCGPNIPKWDLILPHLHYTDTVKSFRDNFSIREFSEAYVQKTQNSILKQRIKKYHFIEI